MTDTTPEPSVPDETDWSDVEQSTAGAAYPELPANPHNHRYTISMNGSGPMVVVRGNTAEEVNAAWQELEDKATGAIMGNAWAAFKAAAMVANGIGPVSAAPAVQAPPAPPAGVPVPPPFGPNVSVPAAPGYAGPPAPPAMPAAPAPQAPNEYADNGWYRVNVPFQKKGEFEAICTQYQMRKGRPSEGGQYSFNKGDRYGVKGWHVHPQYAGAFPMFTPIPA